MGAEFKITGAVALLAAMLASAAAADFYSKGVVEARCLARTLHGGTFPQRKFPIDYSAIYLMVNYCGLTSIDDLDELTGLPNLIALAISNNNLVHLNVSALNIFPNLVELYLTNDNLRQLPVFGGQFCSKMITLGVSGNLLTIIGDPTTFSACAKLKEIFLSNNAILYMHSDLFSQLAELQELRLDRNQIMFIPSGMFAQNKKLKELKLEQNRITHLPPGFASRFRRSMNATFLDVYVFGNPWECACLLEFMADARRADVDVGYWSEYREHSVCTHTGVYRCVRRAPSPLLPPAPRTGSAV